MKLIIVLIFCCLFFRVGFSQKTSIWFNHSMTTSYFESSVSQVGSLKNRFSVGFGLGFNITHAIGKKSSPFFLEYGFQYKGIRQSYLFGNYSIWANTGGLFLPIGFKYLLTLKDNHKFVFRAGVNNLIQFSGETSQTGSNDYNYEITKHGGLFPLIKFGMGYHWGKRWKFEICLHANLGFRKVHDLKIWDDVHETKNEFKGNYFELEFNLKLPRKKVEDNWEE